jgi:cell division protein FtsB
VQPETGGLGRQKSSLDSNPMISYGKENKEKSMAVDFDALDLVRTENKARAYNKKIDQLAKENQELVALVQTLVRELPDEKKWSFEERLKKIKKEG